jgi:hypothetical protein
LFWEKAENSDSIAAFQLGSIIAVAKSEDFSHIDRLP